MKANIPFKLREYQENTRFKANKALNSGENPLIVMDTGTGKTKTDTAIISDRVGLGQRIYVICPFVEVFDQWLDELAFLNPGYINDEGIKGKDRSVYVCMMMSLNNILSIIPESLYPDEIHTDEAHVSECTTNVEIYNFFHKAQRLGMTATPLRYDNKPLGTHYTLIISEINIKEAFKNGFLTPFFYIGAEERIDLIPSNDDSIEDKRQAELLGTPKIIGKAVEVYEQYGDGNPWIVPCCTHQHAKDVREEFEKEGWISEHLHGKLNKTVRSSIIKRARRGELNIITTVGVGVVGLDVPSLTGILWLRLTGSLTIWKQFNGRILRLMKNKEWSFIGDLAGNAVLHGLPDKVYKWDINEGVIKDNEDEKVIFQVCMDCGVYNAPDNKECHFCGADLTGEGRKDGTCRRCINWHKGCCSEPIAFDERWLTNEGCQFFRRRGRSLPMVEDGKLISITASGGIQELKERVQSKKEEIKEIRKLEEEKKASLEEIDSFEKRRIIQKGLFADGVRRSLFAEALEG